MAEATVSTSLVPPGALTGAPPAGSPDGQVARTPRLVALDGLRFFAAVGVMLYHYTVRNSQAWGQPPAEVFPQLGSWVVYFALGPEMFFVLSGFVILMTAWGRSVANVAASRIARLYPAYWAGVLLTGALLLWIWPEGKNVTPGQVGVNLTMFQSLFEVDHVDGVYWTLWTELRFYALILVLTAIGVTRHRVLVFATAWPAAALVADVTGPQWLRVVLVTEYAPLFAAGMVLYVIMRSGPSRAAWLLVAANTAAAVWLVVPNQLAMQARNTDATPSAVTFGVLVVACVALVAVAGLTRVSRMDARWLTAAGTLTYPLYLIHEHWGWWGISKLHPGLPPAATLAVVMTLALVMAAAIHVGVERTLGPRLRRGVQGALERLPSVRSLVVPGPQVR
ncbi:acyltransferase [Cellulomonas fimi]|uniref:Acyltransferase n=1 Tax=Cellulomonas fimi TaxID=1708 RepID=A0A7Y0QI10_CELFI|nr:acyltransferase [Cellulomonas fimi]NMR20850.1 acyltransferase [Cellulomonas fimi]